MPKAWEEGRGLIRKLRSLLKLRSYPNWMTLSPRIFTYIDYVYAHTERKKVQEIDIAGNVSVVVSAEAGELIKILYGVWYLSNNATVDTRKFKLQISSPTSVNYSFQLSENGVTASNNGQIYLAEFPYVLQDTQQDIDIQTGPIEGLMITPWEVGDEDSFTFSIKDGNAGDDHSLYLRLESKPIPDTWSA